MKTSGEVIIWSRTPDHPHYGCDSFPQLCLTSSITCFPSELHNPSQTFHTFPCLASFSLDYVGKIHSYLLTHFVMCVMVCV